LSPDGIDWQSFLSHLDPVWTQLPPKWESGAFTGNGLLGGMAFLTDDGKGLRVHIGRTDVIFENQRIPIGDLEIRPAGGITGGGLRTDLWNAEVTGQLTTPAGTLGIRMFTHTDQLVQVIQLTPDPGVSYTIDWVPGLAIPSRSLYNCLPTSVPPCDPAMLPRPNPVPVANDNARISRWCTSPRAGRWTSALLRRPCPQRRSIPMEAGIRPRGRT
jgi:hypothetical protein